MTYSWFGFPWVLRFLSVPTPVTLFSHSNHHLLIYHIKRAILLSVPWTARRSNQSILKEINPEYSLEGLMLKLKLQYLRPPDAKSWLIGKDPDAEENWGQEVKGVTEDGMVGWHHWQWTRVWANSGRSWWTQKPGMLQSQRVKHELRTEKTSI